MAYNSLAQHDVDASSLLADPDPSGSPAESHSAFPSLSPDLGATTTTTDHSPSDIVEPPITRSREGSIPMRHPTPGLESLQGAYASNVVRLEETAERLSLSSDIGEEIRKMREEQQRFDSRRSSIQQAQSEEILSATSLNRQFSYGHRSHASNSIVETNSVARSGGFSPAAYFASPRGSVKSGTWSNHNSVKGRSASRGPRLTQVTEPEQEGKPLDSPLSTRYAPSIPPLPSPTRALQVASDASPTNEEIEIPMTQSPDPEQEPDEGPIDEKEQPRASQDTYRQAMGLFSDFDGTHTKDTSIEPPPPPLGPSRAQDRLSQMPAAVLPPQDDMVYYPAPVPMMLNLPKRLSKLPPAPKRAQRQSQMIDSLAQDARKSAVWLPEIPQESEDNLEDPTGVDAHISPQAQNRRTMAKLPPQLRASMFFDYPAARQDVAIKGESAVATLDSILDASAFAPVSAFTDHPIAGRAGADIYGRPQERSRTSVVPVELEDKRKRRSSFNNLLKRSSTTDLLQDSEKRRSSLLGLGNFNKRKSSSQQLQDAVEKSNTDPANDQAAVDPGEEASNELGMHDTDDAANHEAAEDVQEDVDLRDRSEEQGEDLFTGAPTTLLAELQMRKQQQKKRTRTAATAFPDGMQSTLLQLDAVAQLEKQNRFKKHTTLAWEDPDAQPLGMQNEDDEDIPLGMLYSAHQMDEREKARRLDEARPLGLIAKRELEDNEPLSHRRARLRGEPAAARNPSMVKRGTMYTLDFPNQQIQEQPQAQSDDEDGEETLAQRKARMKATQIPVAPRRVSNDFASEILTQFGGLEPSPLPPDSPDPVKRTATKTPDLEGVEETLGQRRKRLQAEAATRNIRSEGNNAATVARPPLATRRSMADILQTHPAAGAGGRGAFNEIKYAPPSASRNTAWAANVNRQASFGGLVGGVDPLYLYGGGGGGGYGGMATGQVPAVQVDARQRDMIDRWRQSVMY